jgi:hypothetical protein
MPKRGPMVHPSQELLTCSAMLKIDLLVSMWTFRDRAPKNERWNPQGLLWRQQVLTTQFMWRLSGRICQEYPRTGSFPHSELGNLDPDLILPGRGTSALSTLDLMARRVALVFVCFCSSCLFHQMVIEQNHLYIKSSYLSSHGDFLSSKWLIDWSLEKGRQWRLHGRFSWCFWHRSWKAAELVPNFATTSGVWEELYDHTNSWHCIATFVMVIFVTIHLGRYQCATRHGLPVGDSSSLLFIWQKLISCSNFLIMNFGQIHDRSYLRTYLHSWIPTDMPT